MSRVEAGAAARIRADLDHPVIDSDGHLIEFLPTVMSHLEAIAGRRAVKRYEEWMRNHFAPTAERRRAERIQKLPFWTLPAENTLDRAAAPVSWPIETTPLASTAFMTTTRSGSDASNSASTRRSIPAPLVSERDARPRAMSTVISATSRMRPRNPVARTFSAA